MSRPSLPQANRKNRVVSFRLTAAEYTRIAHKSAACNLRVGDLARMLVLSRSESVNINVISQCDPAVIVQLNHIGHNLNQLVKNAHIFGQVSPEVNRICQTIKSVIDKSIDTEDS